MSIKVVCCLYYQVLHAKQPWRKLVSGFSFACNKHPPQFTDDKSNDSSIREGMPLDALNWFGRGYELHTPKSIGREGSKAWALSVVPHFSLSPPRVTFSCVGWFSRALAFRLLYYPWGKMGDYSQSTCFPLNILSYTFCINVITFCFSMQQFILHCTFCVDVTFCSDYYILWCNIVLITIATTDCHFISSSMYR